MIAKSKKKVLVTGCAGFIGRAVCLKLLESNYQVIGIDNLNNYYSVKCYYTKYKYITNFNKLNILLFHLIKNVDGKILILLLIIYNFDDI